MNILSSIIPATQFEIFEWIPACWSRVAGFDAAEFLQGQFTNDLRRADSDSAIYGLWLSVKGKVVADSFVVRDTDGTYWIGSYRSPESAVVERLRRQVVADDVTIEPRTREWAALTIFGHGALERARAARDRHGGFVFVGRRSKAEHAEWVFPSASVNAAGEEFAGSPRLDFAEIERRRISERIPAVPDDIGPNDLPNEGGLDADAISYDKGCYLGQEIMARLKSMGRIRRRLERVAGAYPPACLPTPPVTLHAANRAVGTLRTCTRDRDGRLLGIAMIADPSLTAAAELRLSEPADPVLKIVPTP